MKIAAYNRKKCRDIVSCSFNECRIYQFTIGLFIVVLLLFSCEHEKSKNNCPQFENVPTSPYSDPIWHPSGKIIGFNHIPIKEIHYSYGYDCPLQANYVYETDSIGFWLINADGTNQHRILPYTLLCPNWSPDGKWIAFSSGAQICIMPFDGQQFDTTAIVQLTNKGINVFPAWSPDGKRIAYRNSDCGTATTPPPPNSCGIIVMDVNGDNKQYINEGDMPFWNYQNNDTLFFAFSGYDLTNNVLFEIYDFTGYLLNVAPRFRPGSNLIAFVGSYPVNDPWTIFTVNSDGTQFKKLTEGPIYDFSWSPDGEKIVYTQFNWSRVSETDGIIWIMDADGTNKKQLTKNAFITIQ